MTKTLSRISSIIFISTSINTLALPGNTCLNMMNAHWQGTYSRTYRGDTFTFPATATTSYLQPYHYSMILNVGNQTIKLTGTCNDYSAIYFEGSDKIAPYYLSGNTDGSHINLAGHHSADVLTISLSK